MEFRLNWHWIKEEGIVRKMLTPAVILALHSLLLSAEAAEPRKFREDIYWISVSPEVDGVIRSGEIYLLLKKKSDYDKVKLKVRVFLSENFSQRIELSHLCRQSDNQLSMVCTRPLAEGFHKLVIETTGYEGQHSELQIPFRVGNAEASEKYEQKRYAAHSSSESQISKPIPLSVLGSVQANSLHYKLSGSHPELRQEPSGTQEIDLNAKVTYKQFSIPVRMFITSMDSQQIQSRNRFQIGVEHRAFSITIGDINPNYDELVLGGIRTRGMASEFRFLKNKVILSSVLGYTQKAIEGKVIRYDPALMVLPINLQPDSTFINRGTYSRYLGCINLTIGKQRERNRLSILFLRSRDDSSSIRFGERPKDNAVAGLDFDLTSPSQAVQWKAGYSISMTTNDITQPILTKEVLKKEYKVDVDYNLKNWAWLIIYNPSTTPLKPETGTSMAWFSNIRFRITKSHTLTLDARQTGPQYQSFGNPFIRTDLLSLSVSEAGRYFKNRLSVQAGYQLNQDNVAQTQLSTRRTGILSGMVGLSPSPKRPFFHGGFRLFDRSTKFRGQSTYLKTDELITLFLQGGFQLIKNEFVHSFSVGSTWVSRRGKQEWNDNESWSAFASFSETPGIPLTISLNYAYLELNQPGLRYRNLQHNLGGSASWEFKRIKLSASLSSSKSIVESNQTLLPNLRDSRELSLAWRPAEAFEFRLSAGHADFRELGTAGKNYQERFIRINGLYRFGT
jgi:hypothetical protein